MIRGYTYHDYYFYVVNQLKLYLVCTFLMALFTQSMAQAVYDTLDRKQSVQFDIGAGGIILFGESNGSGNYYTTLNSYKSSVNFQANVGYSLKIDCMQLEWKIGYAYANYTIDAEQSGNTKGPSASSSTYIGSSRQHAGYVQLIGVTWGKERSWGSLQIGPYVRYNFLVDMQNSDNTIFSGGYFNPPLSYAKGTLGFQFGANFKLRGQGEIHTRIELNSNGNELEDYRAIHSFICLGYLIPFKRDRVTMRRK